MSQEDQAQDQELFHWQLANRPRTPAPTFKPGEKGYGPELCRNPECEENMPEARRAMGERFCTECKALAERRAKRGY